MVLLKTRSKYGTNVSLSVKRAQTVANVLEKNGISKNDITVVGYGAKKPLSKNKTPSGMALNRRAVLVIIEAK